MCHKMMAIPQCQQSETEAQGEAMSQTEDGGRAAVRSKAQTAEGKEQMKNKCHPFSTSPQQAQAAEVA